MKGAPTRTIAARLARAGMTPDPAQAALADRLEALRAALEAPRPRVRLRRRPAPPRGLYIWGDVGRGKSMLMDAFFSALEQRAKRRLHFHALMQEVHGVLHRARRRGDGNGADALVPVAADLARQARCLCLDEMEITDIADAMIVGRLFERLVAEGVTVVVTSNNAPSALYRDGLQRARFLPFVRLIEARLEIVHLAAEADYRQAMAPGDPAWFSPADDQARAALDRRWRALTGGQAPAPLEIALKGRSLHLPVHAGGAARTDFATLCEEPLGTEDYLALAARTEVLFLDAVPRLGPHNRDAARRFMLLVDALYDRGRGLICSAAAPAERLVDTAPGMPDMRRTISRLREMQADGWQQRRPAGDAPAPPCEGGMGAGDRLAVDPRGP